MQFGQSLTDPFAPLYSTQEDGPTRTADNGALLFGVFDTGFYSDNASITAAISNLWRLSLKFFNDRCFIASPTGLLRAPPRPYR